MWMSVHLAPIHSGPSTNFCRPQFSSGSLMWMSVHLALFTADPLLTPASQNSLQAPLCACVSSCSLHSGPSTTHSSHNSLQAPLCACVSSCSLHSGPSTNFCKPQFSSGSLMWMSEHLAPFTANPLLTPASHNSLQAPFCACVSSCSLHSGPSTNSCKPQFSSGSLMWMSVHLAPIHSGPSTNFCRPQFSSGSLMWMSVHLALFTADPLLTPASQNSLQAPLCACVSSCSLHSGPSTTHSSHNSLQAPLCACVSSCSLHSGPSTNFCKPQFSSGSLMWMSEHLAPFTANPLLIPASHNSLQAPFCACVSSCSHSQRTLY